MGDHQRGTGVVAGQTSAGNILFDLEGKQVPGHTDSIEEMWWVFNAGARSNGTQLETPRTAEFKQGVQGSCCNHISDEV